MKASANLATFKERVENGSLNKMLASIYDQFDVIRIYFNGYKKAPTIFHDPLKKIIRMTGPDLTDNGKFAGLDTLMYHELYFTLDDDIIYPSDFRKLTELAIEQYGIIVTYHGRLIDKLDVNYYKGHRVFRCFDSVDGDFLVDVCGTGVTAFDTRYFLPKLLSLHELKRMSDLIFSVEAARQQKQIGMIGHQVGWIKNIENKITIFDTESKTNQENQIMLANEIFKLKHGL